MKLLFITIIFIFSLTTSYSQESFQKVNDSLEVLLGRIVDKDTLIKSSTKYYECSEDLSGRLEFYYQAKKLRLITHVYNQGFGNNTFVEHYFIENDILRLKTLISNEEHINTKYTENSQNTSSFSAEKVIEVTEQRMFFDTSQKSTCLERKHWEKYSDWDQEYFDKLPFTAANCIEDVEDIRYKYRLIRKAEKKLINYSNRKKSCIFYIW